MESSPSTLARGQRASRSTIVVSALVAIIAACQPGPPGSPGLGSPEPHGSPGPSGTVALAESPSPSTSLASDWVRSTIQPRLDAPLTHVVWTGTRFLATDVVEGILLDSTDGRAWHQQRIPGGYVGQIATGPQGLLAIGAINAEDVVAIWHSKDGLTWSPTPDGTSLHGGGYFLTMAAVVALDAGWLAVGGEHLSCVGGACRLVRAVAWTSPDGLQWTRSADAAAMQHAEMSGVVRGPAGYVAVGDAAADPSRADSAIRPAVWTSPDGRTWTRSDQLPVVKAAADDDVILDGVAVTGSRVVAFGHVQTQARAWSDAFAGWSDGGTWSSVEIGRFINSQGVSVAAVPGGLLAMFGTGADPTCASAIWSSADGTSWSCSGNDPAFAGSRIFDAAVSPDVEVLVGSAGEEAAVWISAPH